MKSAFPWQNMVIRASARMAPREDQVLQVLQIDPPQRWSVYLTPSLAIVLNAEMMGRVRKTKREGQSVIAVHVSQDHTVKPIIVMDSATMEDNARFLITLRSHSCTVIALGDSMGLIVKTGNATTTVINKALAASMDLGNLNAFVVSRLKAKDVKTKRKTFVTISAKTMANAMLKKKDHIVSAVPSSKGIVANNAKK